MSEFRAVKLGSRKAPDRVDHFLEQKMLYRKHTLMDATSLFRVFAEELYDSQLLHYEVRMECVRFMFRNRRIFERHVHGDFDDYLWRLEKTQTRGTMLELRAMCLLYGRNVVIYEPFQLGETVTIGDVSYHQDVLRIYKSHNGHFDSVFVMSEIGMAAICQAIAYKLLYTQLFRLPDVSLAVEAMLYPGTFDLETRFEIDDKHNVIRLLCRNGRSFKLDLPEKTLCLLSDNKNCAYHNRSLDLNPSNPPLPISCVRQCLADGGFPLPYAVAKSLDPYTYRNVELYCLVMARREAKMLNIYTGDYNFKVGAKCQVALDPKEPRKMTICHIQHIDCKKTSSVVYSEANGEYLSVRYDALHPLPISEFQPWHTPYKQRRGRQFPGQGPKKFRMKPTSMRADNVLPAPHSGLHQKPFTDCYKTLHSEGKKFILPFPLATDQQLNEDPKRQPLPPSPPKSPKSPPSNQENHSVGVQPEQRAAPAAMPILRPQLAIPQPQLAIPQPQLPILQPQLPTDSHQVFYPMPQPLIARHPFMPRQLPFLPHIIRSNVRFYFLPPPPPPSGAPRAPPVIIQMPFAANNAPMVANTEKDFQPLTH